MKAIDVDYIVRMGYQASINNVKEYKLYATMIWIFDSIFMNSLQQTPGDSPWPVDLTSRNYMTYLLHQTTYLLGMNIAEQYSLVEASRKKWLENGSDPDDNEYELPILKYDAN
jgi:hypothetical protein